MWWIGWDGVAGRRRPDADISCGYMPFWWCDGDGVWLVERVLNHWMVLVGLDGWVPVLAAVEAADADGPLPKAFSVFYLEQSISHRRHFGRHIFNLVKRTASTMQHNVHRWPKHYLLDSCLPTPTYLCAAVPTLKSGYIILSLSISLLRHTGPVITIAWRQQREDGERGRQTDHWSCWTEQWSFWSESYLPRNFRN